MKHLTLRDAKYVLFLPKEFHHCSRIRFAPSQSSCSTSRCALLHHTHTPLPTPSCPSPITTLHASDPTGQKRDVWVEVVNREISSRGKGSYSVPKARPGRGFAEMCKCESCCSKDEGMDPTGHRGRALQLPWLFLGSDRRRSGLPLLSPSRLSAAAAPRTALRSSCPGRQKRQGCLPRLRSSALRGGPALQTARRQRLPAEKEAGRTAALGRAGVFPPPPPRTHHGVRTVQQAHTGQQEPAPPVSLELGQPPRAAFP